MSSALYGVAFCAILFIIYGIVRPRTECTQGGCAACGGACHKRDTTGDQSP